VCTVLSSVPDVVARSRTALARVAATRAAAAAAAAAAPHVSSALAKAFLDVLGLGSSLIHMDVHGLARCARLCQESSALVSETHVWQHRVEQLRRKWNLPCVLSSVGRECFFGTLRPRLDGIYIGECGYEHHIRYGAHFDFHKNAEQIRSQRTCLWVDYRRYLLLLPPEEGVGWALVLQDTCSAEVAEDLLLGINPGEHANPSKEATRVRGEHRSTASRVKSMKATLSAKTFAGQYVFHPETAQVEVKFSTGDGDTDYRVVFELVDGGSGGFSDSLRWQTYSFAEQASGETLDFNLGRHEFDQDKPADSKKDHFPRMNFRTSGCLEHLL